MCGFQSRLASWQLHKTFHAENLEIGTAASWLFTTWGSANKHFSHASQTVRSSRARKQTTALSFQKVEACDSRHGHGLLILLMFTSLKVVSAAQLNC